MSHMIETAAPERRPLPFAGAIASHRPGETLPLILPAQAAPADALPEVPVAPDAPLPEDPFAEDLPVEPVDRLVDHLFEAAMAGDFAAARLVLHRYRPRPCLRFALAPVKSAADAVAASTALIAAVACGRVPVSDALQLQKLLRGHARLIADTERPCRATARDAARKRDAVALWRPPPDPAAEQTAAEAAAAAERKAAMNDPEIRLYTMQAPLAMAPEQRRNFLETLGLRLGPKDRVECSEVARAPGLWEVYPPLALTQEPRTFTISLPPERSLDDMAGFLAELGIQLGPDDRIVRGPVPTFEPLLVAVAPPLREIETGEIEAAGQGQAIGAEFEIARARVSFG